MFSLFTGFIDFIVSPTMSVLGDVLEAILRGLEPNKKKQDSDSVKEVQKDKVNTELGKATFFGFLKGFRLGSERRRERLRGLRPHPELRRPPAALDRRPRRQQGTLAEEARRR